MAKQQRKKEYSRLRGDSGHRNRILAVMAVLGLAAFIPMGLRLYSLIIEFAKLCNFGSFVCVHLFFLCSVYYFAEDCCHAGLCLVCGFLHLLVAHFNNLALYAEVGND